MYSVLRKSNICLKSLHILRFCKHFPLVSRAATLSTLPMTNSKLNDVDVIKCYLYTFSMFCHDGVVVTHSSPTTAVGGSNPRPYVGKLVVAYHQQCTVQNLEQLYVLVSSRAVTLLEITTLGIRLERTDLDPEFR